MARFWRLVRRDYLDTALSGDGARLYGGRFNSEGTRMVYASDSLALAVLESVIHLPSFRSILDSVYLNLEAPAELVESFTAADLPADWRATPVLRSSQLWGDAWIARASAPVARVPSVLLPESWNYLVNPAHPSFAAIRVETPKSVDLDRRFGEVAVG